MKGIIGIDPAREDGDKAAFVVWRGDEFIAHGTLNPNLKPQLLLSVALRLACDRLALYNVEHASAEIRETVRANIERMTDQPLVEEALDLISLRFICEELTEKENVSAEVLETLYLRKAAEFLKGINLYVQENPCPHKG